MFFLRSCRGISFVDRGSVATPDFDTGDFTKNAAFHDLDLSAIVPVGATFVYLGVTTVPNAGGALIIKAKGYAGDYNALRLNGQAAITDNASAFVKLNADRVVEYYASAIAWTMIQVTVKGWIK